MANPTSADVERLIAEAEAVSSMIHMGEKISWGQDTAMIDALIAALRAMQAQNQELALDALAASGQAQEAYEAQLAAEAKLAEVEKERDHLQVERHKHQRRAVTAEATVATLTAQVEAMRGALVVAKSALEANAEANEEVLRRLAALEPAEAGGVVATNVQKTHIASAPVDALVKAAERMEVLSRSQMRTADYHGEGCNCYRCAQDALFAALAAIRGEKP